MEVLVLNGEEVTRLLPMSECSEVMRDALTALARGEALVPLRMIMRVPGASGFVGVMPGYIAPGERRDGALGLKAVLVFPANAKRGIDTHQGAVLLFEADTGRLSARLDEGGHINAVGSSIPTSREIDTSTMAAARLFVDRRESALAEAGDLLIPMLEGAVKDDHVQAELGEVLTGKNPGRRSPRELTLFKSLGLAVEDVASAAYVVRRGREPHTGQTVKM